MEALSRVAEGIGSVKPGNLCPASESSKEKRCYILQMRSDCRGGLKDEEEINDKPSKSSLFCQRRGFFNTRERVLAPRSGCRRKI
jgi:hypothetical protein